MTIQNINTAGAPLNLSLGMQACEGRKVIPFTINFATAETAAIDLTNTFQQNSISAVQSMFVDASSAGQEVVFDYGAENQKVIVPAGAQAYMPVMQTNPPRFTVTCNDGNFILNLLLMNFFVPPYIWYPTGASISANVTIVGPLGQQVMAASIPVVIASNQSAVPIEPSDVGSTDESGTITAGGAGQVLMAANATRKQWTLFNPIAATETLQFSKVGATGPWYDLAPGSLASEDGTSVYEGEIWVIAATTAHAFTASQA